LRCESALAHALSTLGVETTRCERQQVDNSFRILHSRLGSPPPRRFDKDGCVRSRAKVPFDQALGKLEGAGGCPPAALVDARALGNTLVADESTSGSLDALNEVIYCDAASGTPIDSARSASSGGGGYVPSTRHDLRCSDGVGKNLAHLVRDVTGCHVRFAAAVFANVARFDEDVCEARARARYTSAALKLVVRGACPPCLDLTTQATLGETAVIKADQENGRIFICAESATSTTITSTTSTSTMRLPTTTTGALPTSTSTTRAPTTTTQRATTTNTTPASTTSTTSSTTTSTTQQHTTTTRTTTSTTLTNGTTTTSTLPAVFVIVMENQNWSNIAGNPSAPYINNTLLPMASHAEQYYNPPGNHPSEPNYLWLEAGTNFGVRDDNSPANNHQGTTGHLVSLLEAAGVSWKTYQEDISGTVCPVTDYPGQFYVTPHNPFVFFDDVTGSNNRDDSYCIAHVRPYAELATDLGNNTVARYNFITPNVCNDMHGSCAPLSDNVKQGDAWLSTEVPGILASQAYAEKGVLFITWDEAATGDGPIGMIVLSPVAKGGGYSNRIHYTHSSTLRTVEEIFGVSPLLNDAANATDLADLFVTLP